YITQLCLTGLVREQPGGRLELVAGVSFLPSHASAHLLLPLRTGASSCLLDGHGFGPHLSVHDGLARDSRSRTGPADRESADVADPTASPRGAPLRRGGCRRVGLTYFWRRAIELCRVARTRSRVALDVTRRAVVGGGVGGWLIFVFSFHVGHSSLLHFQ